MRLIDADRLNDAMYHEAFETDSKMQKWDSGCWIRYKMFENHLDEAPTIDIVRCKDCQWFDSGKNDIAEWHFCKRHFGIYPNFDADDFCSYGERKGRV